MSEWQPIATAPKDGTTILVSHMKPPLERRNYWYPLGVEITRWWENEVGEEEWLDIEEAFPPTHWAPMPKLPPPPSSEKQT